MIAPAVTHLNNYANIFALNKTFMSDINKRAEKCGYFDFMEKALTFPPAGKFIAPNDSAPGLSSPLPIPKCKLLTLHRL
jgi:carboxypeptidase D